MKNCILFLLSTVFLSLNYSLFPSTVDTVCGSYNGHIVWDADTIKITCDVTCDTLTITPGTVVEFQGYYSILADSIYAVGTKTDSILFTINDTTGIHDLSTTDGGWAYAESGFFGSCDEIIKHKFEYCIFEYGKQVFDHEYEYNCSGGSVLVERCTYRYNYIKDHLIFYGARNCNFIGNNCGTIGVTGNYWFVFDSCTIAYNTYCSCIPKYSSAASIENCNIHHNKGDYVISYCDLDIIVKNSIIHYNKGEYIINAHQCINVSNSVIHNNQVTNVINSLYNIVSVSNSIIHHNKNVGCVISSSEGGITMVNSLIHDNEGSAVSAPNMKVINNQIFNNKGDGIHLGYTNFSSPSVISNNLIYNNGSGISCYETTRAILNNNTVVNNKADIGGGINMAVSRIKMYNNIFRNNGNNNIVIAAVDYGKSSLTIQNCNIEGLNDLEESSYLEINGIDNSFDFNPYFIDTSNFDFHLSDSSLCINAGIIDTTGLEIQKVDLDGNPRVYDGLVDRIDIGAYEFQGEPVNRKPCVVKVSDQQTFIAHPKYMKVEFIEIDSDDNHIIDIISSSPNIQVKDLSGDTANSTYTLIPELGWEGISDIMVKVTDNHGNYDIDTFKLIVSNSFCGEIRENITWDVDTVKVTCDVSIQPDANLTIEPGSVIEFKGPYKFTVKGNLYAIGNDANKIVFTLDDTAGYYNNTYTGWKGIKFLKDGESSNSRLSNCIVEYCNSTPGAIIVEDEHIVISKSIIRNNNLSDNQSAAILFIGANNILSGNIIYNNRATYGGGVYLKKSNLIVNNSISNNISGGFGGGIFSHDGNSLIINNIISNNSCTGNGGGGIKTTFGAPILINNTIANNYSNSNGGGLNSYLSNTVLKNCIIWNNESLDKGDQIYIDNVDDELLIEYCLIRNGENDIAGDDDFSLSGTNKVTDPMFIAPSSGVGVDYNGLEADWSLSSESPCINSGTIDTTGLNLPPYDIEGFPRVFHGRIDIGAYEFISDTIAIVEQPESSITCFGDSISLKIDGIDLFAIQWQKNEINIPDANTKDLKINPVTLEDEGEYRCIVSNIVDTLYSQIAAVTVHEKPQITNNDLDIDVCEKEDTAILVHSNGSSPFTYQWYKNNSILSGLTESVLVLNSVANDDEAIYKSIVINHCGSDSANFQVYVNPLPVIDLGEDIIINEGESAMLDAGEWYSYLWNDNSTERFLEVSQQGTYWAKVTDENGCKNSDTVNVTINPIENINDAYSAPSIKLYPVPFREKIIITLPETEQAYTIKVIDITGSVIRIINPISNIPVELHRGNLSPGVYLLELTTDKGIRMRKVVVE
jgi:hypothetical protein